MKDYISKNNQEIQQASAWDHYFVHYKALAYKKISPNHGWSKNVVNVDFILK